MSVSLYDHPDKWYKCPHCKKPIKVEKQTSDCYGTNSFLVNPKDDEFLDEIEGKELKKVVKQYE